MVAETTYRFVEQFTDGKLLVEALFFPSYQQFSGVVGDARTHIRGVLCCSKE